MHEPLSLGLGYKQLNVISSDKAEFLHSEEASAEYISFSSGSHSVLFFFL